MEANKELFDRIIEKQLDILRKHGAEFIVKKNNGDIIQHGDSLKLHVEPPPQELKKKRTLTAPFGTYKAIYGDIAACILPGDEYTFEVPEGIDTESCRAAFCGWASKNWGSGSYETFADYDAKAFTVKRKQLDFAATVQSLHDQHGR